MKRTNLNYISNYLDNYNPSYDLSLEQFKTFEDVVYYSTEDFGNIISQIFKGLITLVQSILDFIVKSFTRLFNWISRVFSTANINARNIEKRAHDPEYIKKVANTTVSEAISYDKYVELLYVYVRIYQTMDKMFNTTNLIELFNSINNLKPEDPGIYLPPTKYVITDATIKSIEQDLKSVGIELQCTESVEINNDIVWLKCNTIYNSQYVANKQTNQTLEKLGYTADNVVEMAKNSYNTFNSLFDDADVLTKSLRAIKDKLNSLNSKLSKTRNIPELDNPNNKIKRCQYLLFNVSVLLTIYSRIISSSQEYISFYSNITTVLNNIV